MFNVYNYNTRDYNDLLLAVGLSSQDNIVFNSYGLQNANIISSVQVQDNTPTRDFEAVAVPRGDGQIITADFWRAKKILVQGFLKDTTNTLLEARIDAMKKALAVGESNLDINVAGVVRRYVATLTNGDQIFSQRKAFHVTFVPFSLEFTCSTPFALTPSYVSGEYFNQTALVLNDQINDDGTVHAKPVIALGFTAANSITSITFKNNTTGEQIQLTASIGASDYVVFDSEQLTVTKNGIIQDYSGSFPLLATGPNSFTLTIAGVSCTYDLTVKHKDPYL